MSDTYTISEVAADEKLLRRLAGEVLNPGPWRHFWVCGHDPTRPYCLRCDEKKSPQNRDANCPAIKTAAGSLPDIVRELTQKMCIRHDEHRLRLLLTSREQDMLECWWGMAPAEQAACLLAVLLSERVKT